MLVIKRNLVAKLDGVGRAGEIHDALEAAEEALGHAVERYRLALGCCLSCGDFFAPGMIAVAMVDEKGRIGFEHDNCPEETTDYGSSYRNEQQIGL